MLFALYNNQNSVIFLKNILDGVRVMGIITIPSEFKRIRALAVFAQCAFFRVN
jgi:hypothetical protein